jgi:hypothetical protein
MLARPLLAPILEDEALTRHLGDPEARLLVEWLVEQAERLAENCPADAVPCQVERLCRRGRAIAHFVRLWGQKRGRSAAIQLAASERFAWPLPSGAVDPFELMRSIVSWEARPRAA